MIDVEEILSKMNPNQKINYDRVMQKMVQVWEKNEERPTILMHVCCAPCSTYTLEYLTKYADVTIYFANSNIHPKAEYHKRAYVTKKFVSDFNERTGNTVQYLEAPYEPMNTENQLGDQRKNLKVATVARCALTTVWTKQHKWPWTWALITLVQH